jgi:hypothetical protein
VVKYAPICPGLLEISNKINDLILLVVACCWPVLPVGRQTIAQCADYWAFAPASDEAVN